MTCIAIMMGAMVSVPLARSAEPPAANVAEIQAKHDRAFIRELSEYLRGNPDDGSLQSAVLQKPFSPSSLVGTVRDVIGRKATQPKQRTGYGDPRPLR